jgi:hypothetical protein
MKEGVCVQKRNVQIAETPATSSLSSSWQQLVIKISNLFVYFFSYTRDTKTLQQAASQQQKIAIFAFHSIP